MGASGGSWNRFSVSVQFIYRTMCLLGGWQSVWKNLTFRKSKTSLTTFQIIELAVRNSSNLPASVDCKVEIWATYYSLNHASSFVLTFDLHAPGNSEGQPSAGLQPQRPILCESPVLRLDP